MAAAEADAQVRTGERDGVVPAVGPGTHHVLDLDESRRPAVGVHEDRRTGGDLGRRRRVGEDGRQFAVAPPRPRTACRRRRRGLLIPAGHGSRRPPGPADAPHDIPLAEATGTGDGGAAGDEPRQDGRGITSAWDEPV
ncbi:hypothetical protein ACFY8C_18470 [Streptomyces flavochromogenes]|uniref:Uncharacterized protein n=1 Tax=Streptomyces flavochromogenes TaxID=68199 RepID=A0ABW6XS44_9ACTN